MKSLEEYRLETEKALVPMLLSLGSIPERLKEAMIYSLEAGGKRVRPALLLASCGMAGGKTEDALPFACALEMIHTYSLIHDDLPAMDNDDLRRGKPTSHKVFGEAVAILAGDGLLSAAAELMARTAAGFRDTRGVCAMESILRHAGVTGMIAGQSLDVISEGEKPRRELVEYIHTHKTADLLQAPVEAGLILAGADEASLKAGRDFGLHAGLAFQMTDDLLDVTGDAGTMGKSAGQDAANEKMTWVALRGVDGTREDAAKEITAACRALERMPWNTEVLSGFAEKLLNRIQ